jgi:hypothetical protein
VRNSAVKPHTQSRHVCQKATVLETQFFLISWLKKKLPRLFDIDFCSVISLSSHRHLIVMSRDIIFKDCLTSGCSIDQETVNFGTRQCVVEK